MLKKFEINRTKIKGGCQSGRNVVIHNSKSDLPLLTYYLAIACIVAAKMANYIITEHSSSSVPPGRENDGEQRMAVRMDKAQILISK